MIRFCYMTRKIIHYVHNRDFETPWLYDVNGEQLSKLFIFIHQRRKSYFSSMKLVSFRKLALSPNVLTSHSL